MNPGPGYLRAGLWLYRWRLRSRGTPNHSFKRHKRDPVPKYNWDCLDCPCTGSGIWVGQNAPLPSSVGVRMDADGCKVPRCKIWKHFDGRKPICPSWTPVWQLIPRSLNGYCQSFCTLVFLQRVGSCIWQIRKFSGLFDLRIASLLYSF